MAKIKIYVDGAAANNQNAKKRIGGWAYLMFISVNGKIYRKDGSGKVDGATNNQMELAGILQGLRQINPDCSSNCEVEVVSDSEYALGVVSGKSKAKANAELVDAVKVIAKSLKSIKWTKVEGHAGDPFNEFVNDAAQSATKVS